MEILYCLEFMDKAWISSRAWRLCRPPESGNCRALGEIGIMSSCRKMWTADNFATV